MLRAIFLQSFETFDRKPFSIRIPRGPLSSTRIIRDYNANFISELFFKRQEFSVFSQKDCQGSLNLETRWKIDCLNKELPVWRLVFSTKWIINAQMIARAYNTARRVLHYANLCTTTAIKRVVNRPRTARVGFTTCHLKRSNNAPEKGNGALSAPFPSIIINGNHRFIICNFTEHKQDCTEKYCASDFLNEGKVVKDLVEGLIRIVDFNLNETADEENLHRARVRESSSACRVFSEDILENQTPLFSRRGGFTTG